MSEGEQSEDGQVMSGVELSPSDEEETNDSLDIKPPQASSTYYASSKRKEKKAPKDRKHSTKEQQRYHRHQRMMLDRERERDRDRDRDRGEGRSVDKGSSRMDRDHYRDHYSQSARDQHRSAQGTSSSRTGSGSSGRSRSARGAGGSDGGAREGSARERHHTSQYELNPFYGEMRETYDSKLDRERLREREREHRSGDRGDRGERDRDREREYYEKQRRTVPKDTKITDSEQDLRMRLLHRKHRYESMHQRGGMLQEREREMPQADAEMLQQEEAEYYHEKRERRREQQQQQYQQSRRHREEEASGGGRDGRADRTRNRDRGEEVVEIVESPDRHHHIPKVAQTAEEREQEVRRAKLLEADREMLRRKELAREELEARRLRKEEERKDGRSETNTDESDDGRMTLEDDEQEDEIEEEEEDEDEEEEEDDVEMVSDVEQEGGNRKKIRSKQQGESRRRKHGHPRGRRVDRAETNSDTSSSLDSAESDGERSGQRDDEENPPGSPLSVGDLVKSDRRHRKSNSGSMRSRRSHSQTRSGSGSDSEEFRSRSRSPRRRHEEVDSSDSSSGSGHHSRSRDTARRNQRGGDGADEDGAGKQPAVAGGADGVKSPKDPKADDKPVAVVEPKETLPPYYPGIQGCRSVEEFLCLNRIEEGTYGVVYRAKDKRTEEIVALKRLKMEKEKEGFPITSLREINTLLKGQHPNIVTVREIVVGSNMDKIFIVMDYVEHDLKSLMETMKHKKQVFLPGEVKCLTQQLLRAVAHLHDNWILHRDLKTSNLLLSHKGILKVGDFGLAREYGSPLKPYTSIVVTLWYRAPELLLCCKEYSTPIDIWSVGCIFAEFLSMAALFPGKTEIDQLNRIFKDLGTPNEKIWPGYGELPAVQKMTFTEYPVSNLRKKFAHLTSELGVSLLQGLLTFDPKQRLTAEAALQHHYFKELPLPIDPAMFPTWPAKSELGLKKALASSPKPPSGGGEFKKLGDDAVTDNAGFHLGGPTYAESRQLAMGPGFSLKF
ncbi:serine/threonine-protein kinase PITSLRE [Anopheles ziemanni]|uniref:serine/threonine-protein kinase PITSLRE n=1 Tax=Anopheles coustani TaxID=139045 RepID=UPI00265A3EE9|nr:serine/threonine-protein kinase PITSLRE [Anopheles coustani]XP_058174880.1 serine/threonine-protein kinase PITSLRE [Anopheles ziemanni]